MYGSAREIFLIASMWPCNFLWCLFNPNYEQFISDGKKMSDLQKSNHGQSQGFPIELDIFFIAWNIYHKGIVSRNLHTSVACFIHFNCKIRGILRANDVEKGPLIDTCLGYKRLGSNVINHSSYIHFSFWRRTYWKRRWSFWELFASFWSLSYCKTLVKSVLWVEVRNAGEMTNAMRAFFAAVPKAFGDGRKGVMNAAETLIVLRNTNAST